MLVSGNVARAAQVLPQVRTSPAWQQAWPHTEPVGQQAPFKHTALASQTAAPQTCDGAAHWALAVLSLAHNSAGGQQLLPPPRLQIRTASQQVPDVQTCTSLHGSVQACACAVRWCCVPTVAPEACVAIACRVIQSLGCRTTFGAAAGSSVLQHNTKSSSGVQSRAGADTPPLTDSDKHQQHAPAAPAAASHFGRQAPCTPVSAVVVCFLRATTAPAAISSASRGWIVAFIAGPRSQLLLPLLGGGCGPVLLFCCLLMGAAGAAPTASGHGCSSQVTTTGSWRSVTLSRQSNHHRVIDGSQLSSPTSAPRRVQRLAALQHLSHHLRLQPRHNGVLHAKHLRPNTQPPLR